MAIIIKIDIVYRVFGEILNSSHMTRATIPREGDDMQDRRGAVQTGGDAEGRSKLAEMADESASRSGRQPSPSHNEEPG